MVITHAKKGPKMNIEKELKKNGIEVIEKVDKELAVKIAKEVAQKIYITFPNYGLKEEELYKNIEQLQMYKAKMLERNE